MCKLKIKYLEEKFKEAFELLNSTGEGTLDDDEAQDKMEEVKLVELKENEEWEANGRGTRKKGGKRGRSGETSFGESL